MIRARESVEKLAPYTPPLEGRREFVRLDFNENTAAWDRGPAGAGPPGSPPVDPSVYPEYGPLLERLAAHLGVPRDRLLPTNGSGEALFLAAFTFIEPGRDTAVVSAPTFALIPHSLRLVGARLVEVPVRPDLTFDLEGIEHALARGAKLAMAASPDNPTGAVLPVERLDAWCARFPDTLFVADEAYAEYGGETALPLLSRRENLLVVRTFSKAWGLAGLRLGVIAGSGRLVSELAKVRAPYSVNAAAVDAALRVLPNRLAMERAAREARTRRDALVREVARRGYGVRAGAAHFFLLRAGMDATFLVRALRERGVLVRDRSSVEGLAGCIRVNTGTEEENRVFLECLDAIRRSRCLVFDLDGTLVDTTESYDVAVAEIVRRRCGTPPGEGELRALRGEGGFNDDWDAAAELLARRGAPADREAIAREGRAIYLARAREAERLLVDPGTLRMLGRRYRLFILTGRPRSEYEPVWGKTLDPLFERVLCRDDFPPGWAKPSPAPLNAFMGELCLEGGFYVGDSVDDMRAAAGAGLTPVGVCSTQDRETLLSAGAAHVIGEPGRVGEAFGLDEGSSPFFENAAAAAKEA